MMSREVTISSNNSSSSQSEIGRTILARPISPFYLLSGKREPIIYLSNGWENNSVIDQNT